MVDEHSESNAEAGQKSDYERGFEDGLQGKPAPPFSKPDTSWSARLYERGWSAGADKRIKDLKSPNAKSGKPDHERKMKK